MALTLVQEVRLTIGLIGNAYDLLSDDEITHYLTKNNNNIRRTCLDCGKTVLFILAQLTHTKADVLEEWTGDWFNNYYKTLQMYMNDPNFSFAINGAMPYAGGISVSDIRANVDNSDNFVVNVDGGIPTDGIASCSTNTNQQVFKRFPDTF